MENDKIPKRETKTIGSRVSDEEFQEWTEEAKTRGITKSALFKERWKKAKKYDKISQYLKETLDKFGDE